MSELQKKLSTPRAGQWPFWNINFVCSFYLLYLLLIFQAHPLFEIYFINETITQVYMILQFHESVSQSDYFQLVFL